MVMATQEEKAEKVEASPKKAAKEASEGTPSGLASKEAGKIADDASDEEKVAWNEKYLEAKLKARRG
jgi:hypothetical protein